MVLATAVHCSVVLVDYILALLAVGLHDEVLHLLDSLLYWNNARDTEESRLEDGVGTVAKTNLASDLGSIDVVHLDIVVSEVFLHLVWQVLSEFLAFPDSVEQEGTTLLETAGYIVHLQVCLYVASHEVRSSNEVSRVDWFVTETEVRASETTRLLGVVREVCLAVLVSSLADDLHRVFVSTYGTVSTKSVELSLEHALATHSHLCAHRERSEGNIILYAEGEVVLRHRQSEVLVSSDDLRWSGIVGTETIAATYYEDIAKTELLESVFHIEVQWFAISTWLFGAVEHADTFHRSRQCLFEVLE